MTIGQGAQSLQGWGGAAAAARLEPLFAPCALAGLRLPNRFVLPPMQRFRSPDQMPGQDMIDYYRERIEGGIGLAIVQGTTIDHWTSASPYARLFPAAYPAWRALVRAVHGAGGRIFLQLWHEGASRDQGYGPSGVPLYGAREVRTLTDVQIEDLVEAFARHARIAQDLGFDGIEIHGAHGYLIDSFMWAFTNRRTGRYGGSLEARLRFPAEIIRATRRAVGPAYPISFRFSQWKGGTSAEHGVPAPTPEALGAWLLPLAEAGVDIFHASARRLCAPAFAGSDLSLAGWTKRLTGRPVIGVGSVGLDADLDATLHGARAEAARPASFDELMRRYAGHEFDLVAVGRAVLADAQWVGKLRDGRFADLGAVVAGHLVGDG